MGMPYCRFVALQVVLLFSLMTCTHASYWTYLNRFNVKPLDNDTSDESFTLTEGTSFSECLYPSDCQVVQNCEHNKSGVYRVFPFGVGKGFLVYCDMVTNGGGWLVFQRRQDGTEDFFRNWQSYKDGFGNLYEEFWLGLDKIHLLTSQRHYELLINLENFEGKGGHAVYSRFRISGEKDKYRLMVGGYTGSVGDAIYYHDGSQFSTRDRDNDGWETGMCSDRDHGAWWYKECHNSNLNGEYVHAGKSPMSTYSGFAGYTWQKKFGNMQFAEMKIRPVGNP